MKFKKIYIIVNLLILLASVSSSRAGTSNKSGNPFGNGSFFSTGGTFNGVLRGVDLIGITQFSTPAGGTNTGTDYSAGPLYFYSAASGVYDDTLFVYAQLDPSGNNLTALILPKNDTPFDKTANNNISLGGGSFEATLKSTPPNQTYQGSGVISEILNTNTPGQTTNLSFTISGTRIGN